MTLIGAYPIQHFNRPILPAGLVRTAARATSTAAVLRSYEDLCAFVDTVSAAGCQTFIVHARKALLSGLSPKQNRMVPPLQHDFVYAIKRERPALHIVLNGGVKCVGEAAEHLQHVDGVMIGRAAYFNPQQLASADEVLFGDVAAAHSDLELLAEYSSYAAAKLSEGYRRAAIFKHLSPLFQARPGSKQWRQRINQTMRDGDTPDFAQIYAECFQL